VALKPLLLLMLPVWLSACVALDVLQGVGTMGSAAGSAGSASAAGEAAARTAPAPSPTRTRTARDYDPDNQAGKTFGKAAEPVVAGIAATEAALVGIAVVGATQRATASCRAVCEDGAQSIGCPADKTPVCQCEQKPYTACR